MRLALDATYSIGEDLTGVGVYSREIIFGVAAAVQPGRVELLYRPRRFLRSWRDALPPNARRGLLLDSGGFRNRLFHGLNQRLPTRAFRMQVTTFHDLFVMTSEYSTPEFRARFTGQARCAALASDAVIAVSEFTASQVHELLGVERSRIFVIHHGVHPRPPVREPEKIVLHVGTVQRRKNLVRLVAAFRALPEDWRLVLAGGFGYAADEVLGAVEASPARARIELTGYVSGAELARWYARASIFAFPSLDEGFGIPVLEAMSAGIPVIASNRGALPEVCGRAAILVDAFDEEQLAQSLQTLANDPEVRRQLIAAGLSRVAGFTWGRAVQQTLAVYRELSGGGA